MIRLYLVRHGQTVENLEHILQGHMPGHLTNAGKEQMRQLGKELAGIHFDHLLCSDLQRAIDSAICMNLSLPVTTTPLLRERDWGIFTGCKIETIRRDEAFPESVESTEQLYCRATLFIEFLLKNYDGKSILCVSHGLFNRFISSVVSGKPYYEIPRFENSGFQKLQVEQLPQKRPCCTTSDKDEASAN